MSNWVCALGEWWKWAMGESSLPGPRSRLYLAGTAAALTALAAVAVMAAGDGPAKVGDSASLASTQVTVGAPFSDPVPTSTPPSAATTTTTAPAARGRAVHPSQSASPAVPPVSSAASGPVLAAGAAPSSPTDLAVTVGKGWARLGWSPPTSSGGDPVDGYDVYVGTSPGGEGPTPANGAPLIPTTAYTVDGLALGTTYYFTVRASSAGGLSDPSAEASSAPGQSGSPGGAPATPVVGMAALPDGSGYWLVDARGTVSARGAAVDYGSAVDLQPGAVIVQIAATPDGLGYWEAASDGEVFGFGDARVFGSASGVAAGVPVVGLAPTRDGQGYWEVTSAGGVFSFGDAAFLGPIGGLPSAPPIVGIAADPATGGYWLAANDGGIYGYGAPSFGSTAGTDLNQPVIGMAGTGRRRGLLGGGQRRRCLHLRRRPVSRLAVDRHGQRPRRRPGPGRALRWVLAGGQRRQRLRRRVVVAGHRLAAAGPQIFSRPSQ